MRTLNIVIPAGSSSGALAFAGNYFRVDDASAPFWLRLGNRAYVEIKKGIEGQAPGNWEHIELENKTAGDITVTMVIGESAQLVLRSFLVVGDVTATLSQGDTLTNAAAVAVTDAATAIAAVNSARRALHIRNAGGSAVRLGGAAVTWATGAIELLPGEEWREEAGAAAAWYAITDAGQASSVVVMGVE